MVIDVLGIDAAFANMGFARCRLTIEGGVVTDLACDGLCLVSTEAHDAKVVRKSSNELRRARELLEAMTNQARRCQFAFAEVPSGSQSASAARSLGIAVGVLAACPIPLIEVSPMEVKIAVSGKQKGQQASKADIIEWAATKWPDAPWLRAIHKAKSKGKVLPAGRLLADNEHMADAIASVLAGTMTPEFQRLLVLAGPSLRQAPKRQRVALLEPPKTNTRRH